MQAPAAAQQVQDCLPAAGGRASALLLCHAVQALEDTPHLQRSRLYQHRLHPTHPRSTCIQHWSNNFRGREMQTSGSLLLAQQRSNLRTTYH